LKQEKFDLAISDTTKTLEIQPKSPKSLYRRALAYCALNKWKEAMKDLNEAKEILPNDADIREKYKWVSKEKAYRDLSKCISYGSLVDRMMPEDIVVEENYEGLILDDLSNLTHDWILNLIVHFKRGKCLHKRYVIKMIKALIEHYRSKPSLIDLDIQNITICGDIHGQFFDLLTIFNTNGYPSTTNPYLFNGDFVDRGSFSIEVMLTLIAWNLLYPHSFFLNRGNHESTEVNMLYGFYGEVKTKYDKETYSVFRELFFALPLCYLINKKIFVVHGGLPNDEEVTLDDIRRVERFREPPDQGLMTDLLWSDFVDEDGLHLSAREVCCAAGPDITARFAKANNIKLIVRGHEVKTQGYEVQRGNKVVTVFSAPNYCDQVGNSGAYVRFKAPDMEPEYIQFKAVVLILLLIAASKQATNDVCYSLYDILIHILQT